ncbi:hypothetical protein N5S76_03990 [Aliarcobacter cryaerophilus]|uniref:hypothetical protein n=1 Tax=Aliarcobacter cryaerophilus TaxID=28198 RepID=UPI0021B5585A|nr:hypothetical protein [Aliarcobacter cryaerophilus]MCT7498941.1 hypothetical protein [Aliarcobacter cryaerophilus]
MKEKQIQKKIIEYLNKNGVYTVKSIVTNRSGSPDIICCFNGLFVALEVKTEKGIISKLQEYHQKEILKSGGIALIVRSLDEVKILMDNLKGTS